VANYHSSGTPAKIQAMPFTLWIGYKQIIANYNVITSLSKYNYEYCVMKVFYKQLDPISATIL
jgi:hypothetical protein